MSTSGFWREVGYELSKLKSQKKNFVAAGGHLLLLLLCLFGLWSRGSSFMSRNLGRFDYGVDPSMFLDGLFFARAALLPTFLVLMPIFVCTLAGESLAGEYQDGTLKLYLARGRSRTRLVLIKFTAIYLFTLLFSVYFGILGLAVGTGVFGWSDSQLVLMNSRALGSDFVLMTPWAAMKGYICSVFYFSLSGMALGGVAMFLSSIFNRMTGATVGAITFYFVCYIVDGLPFADAVRPYLLSRTMDGAFVFWLPELPWGQFTANMLLLAAYTTVSLLLAICIFGNKDIR
ncbi:ABC transporter permease [Victivallis vadensis]|jgi:membrane protein|uniref:ABC transporter permease n=1 Tax=Victivallis vadensis TaxID=172901 RepID=UPI003AF5323F